MPRVFSSVKEAWNCVLSGAVPTTNGRVSCSTIDASHSTIGSGSNLSQAETQAMIVNGRIAANSNENKEGKSFDGTFTYTPTNPDQVCGTDKFVYEICDGPDNVPNQLCDTAEVSIYVNCDPIANPDSATTSPGETVTLDLLANDTDPDGAFVPDGGDDGIAAGCEANASGNEYYAEILSQPVYGSVIIKGDGNAEYTAPNSEFCGIEDITYRTCNKDNCGGETNTCSPPTSAIFTVECPACYEGVDYGEQASVGIVEKVVRLSGNPQLCEGGLRLEEGSLKASSFDWYGCTLTFTPLNPKGRGDFLYFEFDIQGDNGQEGCAEVGSVVVKSATDYGTYHYVGDGVFSSPGNLHTTGCHAVSHVDFCPFAPEDTGSLEGGLAAGSDGSESPPVVCGNAEVGGQCPTDNSLTLEVNPCTAKKMLSEYTYPMDSWTGNCYITLSNLICTNHSRTHRKLLDFSYTSNCKFGKILVTSKISDKPPTVHTTAYTVPEPTDGCPDGFSESSDFPLTKIEFCEPNP